MIVKTKKTIIITIAKETQPGRRQKALAYDGHW